MLRKGQMAIYKRGRVYWYKFVFDKKVIRESTRQGNDKVARQMESAHRTSLAKGEVGLREKKPVPRLAEFCEQRFEPWIKTTTALKTWLDFYRVALRAIKSYRSLASLKLDEITSEDAAQFASWRRAQKGGLEVATVNSSRRVLRRVLRQAAEWDLIQSVPKIKMLPGERHRERVLTVEEEARYLASATEPLTSVATVLADTGMRPEECYRLRWEMITWHNGRHGTLLVTHGKTKAARRVLPLTARVREVLQKRWEEGEQRQEGWVWPASTKSEHVEPSTLKKKHRKAIKNGKVRPFVLYSLRHTFLTRLGESGCDAWTLARIAGHSSITISARYVHPSEDAVLNAMLRVGGHKSGHNEEPALREIASNKVLSD
jgi:integrase